LPFRLSRIDARWSVAVSVAIEGMTERMPAGRMDIPIAAGRMVSDRARATGPFRVTALPPD
jgi:hypothetical protein